MGSRSRAQSSSSVNKTSQWQLACVFRHAHPAPQRGYKRRARAKAHQLFASEPSLSCESLRVSTDSYKCWCYGASAEVAIQCCCFSVGVLQLFNCGLAATSPVRFSTFLKEHFSFLKRANSKRAPRATGVFLKMASRSCVSGCGHFLASSDGHDRCVSCLGFQHAEAALVDDSCSLCGNMTIAMLRSRYLLVKRGGIPLAMPRSSSSGSRRATSAHGQGDLRITVRASPSSASPRASHSSSASHRLGFPDELVESSDRAGAQHLVRSSSRWQDVDHCIGGWARFWRWWFGCAASIRKSGVARVRSWTDCYAFPGRWERRAALEASSFSRTLEAGRLVPGGAGRSPATASGSILPGSAWGGD